ncbi:hypothetical protein F7725_003280 [Dissostichus mawsoni]|uniref:Uncharacterized protein n=1 Tax=Dissostichus mawsoni TaxID=36200 RepID=A0A7J5Y9T2_DISMA|nr:hypothetical protein F7725_003280 [Dissostichus mawsoni]
MSSTMWFTNMSGMGSTADKEQSNALNRHIINGCASYACRRIGCCKTSVKQTLIGRIAPLLSGPVSFTVADVAENRQDGDAVGCELLSSNQSLAVGLVTVLHQLWEADADWLLPAWTVWSREGFDWSRGPGQGRVGLAAGLLAPGPTGS